MLEVLADEGSSLYEEHREAEAVVKNSGLLLRYVAFGQYVGVAC